ncbi:Carbonic anhydrase-related protein [Apis cerana cerana]|uniref:Carbonic anhydrase-related protein n=1 Tax=Apis cerana cerana TaxID=94128 RepID=A0A2A3EHU7_APICC|nr:Carbonic anhydrase-related protein [Apis cerana cerana]
MAISILGLDWVNPGTGKADRTRGERKRRSANRGTNRDAAPVRHLSLKSLLPDTNGYMTYEGSTTHPGCWETAVWLILNKPIYVTARELYALRKLMQGPPTTPKAPLGNNSRPLQDLHYRTIRTNIDFRKRPDAKCPSMAQDMHYRGNPGNYPGSSSPQTSYV